jgi:8-oxo-dGTP diphosphatase
VFLASEFVGEPTETPEAAPFWAPLDRIPYDRMWEDDRHWLPQVLAGQTLIGKFSFEGERMLTKEITLGWDF